MCGRASVGGVLGWVASGGSAATAQPLLASAQGKTVVQVLSAFIFLFVADGPSRSLILTTATSSRLGESDVVKQKMGRQSLIVFFYSSSQIGWAEVVQIDLNARSTARELQDLAPVSRSMTAL